MASSEPNVREDTIRPPPPDDLGSVYRLEREGHEAEQKLSEDMGSWCPFGRAVFDGEDRVKPAEGDIFAVNVLVEKYDVEGRIPAGEMSYVLLMGRLYCSEPTFRCAGVGIIMDKSFFQGMQPSCVTLI